MSEQKWNPGSVIQNSPGLAIREIDLTNFVPFESISAGALVGQFVWGPVEKDLTISSTDSLLTNYGKPNEVNFIDWFCAYNFLSYSNNLKIIRVLTESIVTSIGKLEYGLIGTTEAEDAYTIDFLGIIDSASSMADYGDLKYNPASSMFAFNSSAHPDLVSASGILVKNDDHFQQFISYAGLERHEFCARYPGVLGNSIRVSMCDSATFEDWEYAKHFDSPPGTSEMGKKFDVSNDEVHLVVVDKYGMFTNVKNTILEKYSYLSKASDARDMNNAPIYYGAVINARSNYVWYLGPPALDEIDDGKTTFEGRVLSFNVTDGGSGYVSADSVVVKINGKTEAEGAGAPGFGAGIKVTLGSGVRFGQIIEAVPAVTGEGIQVIGRDYATPPRVTVNGNGTDPTRFAVIEAVLGVDKDNRDKVVRYRVIDPGEGYGENTPTQEGGHISVIPDGVVFKKSPFHITFDETDHTKIKSINIESGGHGYTTTPLVTIEDVLGHGMDAEAEAVMLKDKNAVWGQPYISLKTGEPNSFRSLKRVYSRTFFGGSDGERITANEIIEGWTIFRDPEVHDISLVISGATANRNEQRVVNQFIIDNVAEYRKDCVAFISPNLDDVLNKTQSFATANVIERRNDLERSSNYVVMDTGWKLQYDQYNDKYRWLPLNADIAGLCAATDASHDPWWSPAGYTRGRIKNCVSLAFNPNKTSRDELYKLGINPVVTFLGEGSVLFGDKTLQYKPSAFSWINVRRLFLILEKSISRAAKYYLFEFNDRFTRARFNGIVDPFLREVKGRRGIYDYRVICDETNNTGEIIDRGEFVATILIKPARSINFITLNFVAVKTDVSFSELM